jgi:hypothetical protein
VTPCTRFETLKFQSFGIFKFSNCPNKSHKILPRRFTRINRFKSGKNIRIFFYSLFLTPISSHNLSFNFLSFFAPAFTFSLVFSTPFCTVGFLIPVYMMVTRAKSMTLKGFHFRHGICLNNQLTCYLNHLLTLMFSFTQNS